MAESNNNGYYSGWNDVIPKFDDPPVHVTTLGALITIGSIVKLIDGRIVRLLSCSSEASAFRLDGNLFSNVQNPPPLDPPMNPFIRFIRDKEVAETKRKVVFAVSDIADLAFVFSKEDVQQQGLCLHGVNNAYFTRFRYESNDTKVAIPQGVVYFSSDSSVSSCSCYSKRIWDGLLTLQSLFRTILSRGSLSQGEHTTYKVKFPFSREIWDYLRARLSSVATTTVVKMRQIRARLIPGMATHTLRFHQDGQRLELSTEDQFISFQDILGSTVLFGSRHRRPKIGEVSTPLTNNHYNVITHESYNNYPPSTIQLSMDGMELHVKVSYVLYSYRADENGYPVGCPSPSLFQLFAHLQPAVGLQQLNNNVEVEPELQAPPSPSHIWHGTVIPGVIFENNEDGLLYVVSQVNYPRQEIICHHYGNPEMVVVMTDFESVSDMIMQYN
jgi:hypothetical protein